MEQCNATLMNINVFNLHANVDHGWMEKVDVGAEESGKKIWN